MLTETISTRLDRVERQAVERWGASRTAVGLMVCAMLVWPLVEAVGGGLLSTMHPLELIWLRYAVHLALLLLFGATGSRAVLMRTRSVGLQIGRSSLMLGMPVFWLLAGARMPSSTVMGIFWTTPFVAIIGAAVLLRERPTALEAALAVAGFVGILLVLRPAVPHSGWGLLCALVMSGCYGLYLVGTRYLRHEPTVVNLFYSALGVFVALTPLMPFVWRWPAVSTLPAIGAVGVSGLVLLFLLDRALHIATLARTASIGFVQPAAEAFFFGGASLGLASRAASTGLLMILCVVAVSVLQGHRGVTQTPNDVYD